MGYGRMKPEATPEPMRAQRPALTWDGDKSGQMNKSSLTWGTWIFSHVDLGIGGVSGSLASLSLNRPAKYRLNMDIGEIQILGPAGPEYRSQQRTSVIEGLVKIQSGNPTILH